MPVFDSKSGIAAATAASGPTIGADIDYGRFLDCVHCGLCSSACPTYLETGNENDSPRGRIYLMRAVVDGRIEFTSKVQRHLDLCLDCRSCETACPSGVQYGRLIEPFRVDVQRKRVGASPGWFHRLILYGLLPNASRLRWGLLPVRLMQRLGLDRVVEKTKLLRLLPRKLRQVYELLPELQPAGEPLPKVLPALGPRRARVALFTGCVADAIFRQTNWATARVLQVNGCEVLIPSSQVCCGAIAYHGGAGDPALALPGGNTSAFDVDDVDAVITNVAGCGSMLKNYGRIASELLGEHDGRHGALSKLAGKVRDVSEFLAQRELAPMKHDVPLRVAYDDPCHLIHAQGVRAAPRDLLGQVPGLTLVELPEADWCCGSAGSFSLRQPKMARRVLDRKMERVASCEAEVLASGNPGCLLQLAAGVRRSRLRMRVLHPIQLLARAYTGKA